MTKTSLETLWHLVLFAYSLLAISFVGYKFAKWFMPFDLIIAITYKDCICIVMILALLSYKTERDLKDEYYKDSESDVYIRRILAPWVLLLLGYIVQLFLN